MLSYQEEKDIALQYMIDKIFKIYKISEKDSKSQDLFSLELYVTPDCNQNCSYCYLCKHKDDLYPKELRKPETILKNIKILLDYLIEKGLNPGRLDLFSGEIWDTQFGYDVLEAVYQALVKGLKPGMIIIPSNCSFVLKDDSLNMISNYIEKFKEQGVRLCFSCSNDGWYIDKMARPFNNEEEYELKKGTQAYYDCIFDFCKKQNFGFHPMVSAHGIEYWQENFKWWMDNLIEKDFHVHGSIMFLEVRNDDWTEEKIIHFLKYLNFATDYWINNIFPKIAPENNSKEMFQHWVHHELKSSQLSHYTPLMIGAEEYFPGCTIHRSLVVRLGDLAIVPCHRTSYDEFVGGYFKVENDKIVGVHAENIQVMNQVWLNNMQGSPKCGGCIYSDYCLKGCFGSQFESTGDLLYPCETVCDLYKARFIFLYHKYSKLGVLDEKKDKQMLNIIEKIKDTEDYHKWTKITQQII